MNTSKPGAKCAVCGRCATQETIISMVALCSSMACVRRQELKEKRA
jgi:hypothetical protein